MDVEGRKLRRLHFTEYAKFSHNVCNFQIILKREYAKSHPPPPTRGKKQKKSWSYKDFYSLTDLDH